MGELTLLGKKLTTNTVETFIKNAWGYPDISLADTVAIFEEFNETKNRFVLEPLILANLKQVCAIALNIKRKTFDIHLHDLVQAGCVGLMTAIGTYNWTLNVAFSTHAYNYIRGEIFTYLTNNFTYFKFSKEELKVFYHYSKVNKRLSRKDSLSVFDLDELSKEFNTTPDVVNTVVDKMNSRFMTQVYGDDDTEDDMTIQPIADTSLCNPEDIMVYEEYENAIDLIHSSLHILTDRENDIISGRYLAEKKLPFKHYAEKYNVSIERIRQIESDAINKLKKKLVKVVDSHLN